jgi:hypothetical protein
VLVVDCATQTVTEEKASGECVKTWTFQEFVDNEPVKVPHKSASDD